jgi:hypothetical protein
LGPWIETTRRVDGEDVSMYADPGAVVMRLVRRTSEKGIQGWYIFVVVLGVFGLVLEGREWIE